MRNDERLGRRREGIEQDANITYDYGDSWVYQIKLVFLFFELNTSLSAEDYGIFSNFLEEFTFNCLVFLPEYHE